jgi:predicted ester cyclase
VTGRDAVVQWYRRYLDACNRRAWTELADFLGDHVLVNGVTRSRDDHVADVRATVAAFDDCRWELRRAVVEGEWIAVHLHDTATRTGPFRGRPADGARVVTEEFDMYRIVGGAIVEVEDTADNAPLIQ